MVFEFLISEFHSFYIYIKLYKKISYYDYDYDDLMAPFDDI